MEGRQEWPAWGEAEATVGEGTPSMNAIWSSLARSLSALLGTWALIKEEPCRVTQIAVQDTAPRAIDGILRFGDPFSGKCGITGVPQIELNVQDVVVARRPRRAAIR